MSLIDTLVNERSGVTESVMEFEYNRKRVRILSGKTEVKSESTGIIYWMYREMRVQDNWSFLFAQKLALKNKIPLYVIYFFMPGYSNASPKHLKFMLHGLIEVSNECYSLNIPFYLYPGDVDTELPKIVEQYKIGAVVCDFSPLRFFKNWLIKLQSNLPDDVVLCQVDGHNIVPCWISSDKQENGARTIRPKIMSKLDEFLTTFPPVIKHLYTGKLDLKIDESIFSRYDSIELPQWIQSGYRNGIQILESFCKERLENYCRDRNNPTLNAVSHLSPWLNYGQIAPQRCVLEVTKYKKTYIESFNSFCEEIIVRRELSDNFCYYNDKYDQLEGCAPWAQITLNQHKNDVRNHLYTTQQFEDGRTHDPLWNAAQMELVKGGKMHGYLRMYWAKKILEWTESPEKALEVAIYLNDKYSFDGRDPNGYVGIMWSIGGVHDQGWIERAIFGKVRYMSYDGCAKKFVVHEYIQQWGRPEDLTLSKQIKPSRKRKRNT